MKNVPHEYSKDIKEMSVDELKKEMRKINVKSASIYVSPEERLILMDQIDELKKQLQVLERKNVKSVPVMGADIVANHKKSSTGRMSNSNFLL